MGSFWGGVVNVTNDQPVFRFNPVAYEDGHAFVRSDDDCDVCSCPCVWKYTGSIYALESPTVCARCIANGKLGDFFKDGHFSLHDIEINGSDSNLEEEVIQRTPGVACFNPYQWPVIESKPLAFVGYGENKDLIALSEVKHAIDEAFSEIGWKFEGPTPYALIFKEIDGDLYRAVIDLD